MFLRLRQICLVALDLEKNIGQLSAVFGPKVCHRDPGVGRFGLHNAILAFGSSFLEIVSPLQDGTAAGRYLDRRNGDGGYMVILDSNTLEGWGEHLSGCEVRIAASLEHDSYQGLQLHPADTGGTLLEINTTQGNQFDIDRNELSTSPYWPAGSHWQPTSDPRQSIDSATLQSRDPQKTAGRWGQILGRTPVLKGEVWALELNQGSLYFTQLQDARGEGLVGISIALTDPAGVLARADAMGCLRHRNVLSIAGIQIAVTPSHP
jgi:hypothetical protein